MFNGKPSKSRKYNEWNMDIFYNECHAEKKHENTNRNNATSVDLIKCVLFTNTNSRGPRFNLKIDFSSWVVKKFRKW